MHEETVDAEGYLTEPLFTPEREGYVFEGWYRDSYCMAEADFTRPVTSDMTLYAKWTKAPAEAEPAFTDTESVLLIAVTVAGTVLMCGALAALVADYGELEKRLKAFYRLFLAQRERECKPQGFEKQDIRLGGLMQRVSHCRRVLSEYLACRRDRIEELEEHILPFADGQDGAPVCFNDWLHTAQIKPLM